MFMNIKCHVFINHGILLNILMKHDYFKVVIYKHMIAYIRTEEDKKS